MFTGLVENVGIIISLRKTGRGLKLFIRPEAEMELHIGNSVSVNGVCLTVTECSNNIAFEISPETIRSSNLGKLKVNDRVNLERPLRLNERLGGHIVTGHVDGIGTVTDKKSEGEFTFYIITVPLDVLKYIVIKGSVAVDGISLTITGLDERSFSVAIIPHTLKATNIIDKNIGDTVNVEVDIIGKYVEKFVTGSFTGSNGRSDNQRLMELLKEKGFPG